MKLLLCVALKEEKEGDGDTRHTFVVKKKKKNPATLSFNLLFFK